MVEKVRLLNLAVGFFLLGLAPAFAADAAGFYAGIYAGPSVRSDSKIDIGIAGALFSGTGGPPTSIVNTDVPGVIFDILKEGQSLYPESNIGEALALSAPGTVNFLPSFTGGAVFGYRLGNGFRVEADLSSASYDAVGLTLGETSGHFLLGELGGGGVWTWTGLGHSVILPGGLDLTKLSAAGAALSTSTQFLFVNTWRDFDTGTGLSPYLGGGMGLARVTSTLDLIDTQSTASAIVPAAQIGGGLRYAVTDRVSVDLGYRYRLAVNPQISNVFVQPVSGDTMIGIGSHQHGTIGVHVVQLGLTFALQ